MDCKARKEEQATSIEMEPWMMRPQQTKQVFQDMSPRDGHAAFDHQSFQKLFRGLLAVVAN